VWVAGNLQGAQSAIGMWTRSGNSWLSLTKAIQAKYKNWLPWRLYGSNSSLEGKHSSSAVGFCFFIVIGTCVLSWRLLIARNKETSLNSVITVVKNCHFGFSWTYHNHGVITKHCISLTFVYLRKKGEEKAKQKSCVKHLIELNFAQKKNVTTWKTEVLFFFEIREHLQ